jgi:hypothetical protein
MIDIDEDEYISRNTHAPPWACAKYAMIGRAQANGYIQNNKEGLKKMQASKTSPACIDNWRFTSRSSRD